MFFFLITTNAWALATKISSDDNIRISWNRVETLRNIVYIVHEHAHTITSSFEKRCKELKENLCTDNFIIALKEKLINKQNMKGKPMPWGVNVFWNYIYPFGIYQCYTTLPAELLEKYSATCDLVIHFSNRIPYESGHKLYCDNYSTSLLYCLSRLNTKYSESALISEFQKNRLR